MKVANSKSEI